jgi:acyl carrier protein
MHSAAAPDARACKTPKVETRKTMGLDTVELVMAIEVEFGIEIPNTAAPNLAVLGDLCDYIVLSLLPQGEQPNEQEVWQRLSEIVVEQLGVRPEQVTRTAHLIDDLHAD